MTLLVADIKKYLRITHNVDDAYLEGLKSVAKQFITEQTGVEYNESDKVYEQGILFLVAHLYDNRSPVSEKAIAVVPYTLEAIIFHLKIRGAYTPANNNGNNNEESGS